MKVIGRIRKSYITKGVAVTVALNMLGEMIYPTAAMALTTGPSQPEVQSFEPVETTDMVNMFTGDFTYNIPLIYLPGPNGGYPINLAYHGGVGMDQEASWVGLGWNINAGALVRNVRGYADDYDGDELITKVDMKSNVTAGLSYGVGAEIFGAELGINTGVRYNNYKGFAVSVGVGFPLGDGSDFGMGISLDSETGLGFSARYSFDGKWTEDASNTVGISYSNEGLGMNFSREKNLNSYRGKKIEEGVTSKTGTEINLVDDIVTDQISAGSSSLGFASRSHMPSIGLPLTTNNLAVNIKFGAGYAGVFADMSFGGFFNTQYLKFGVKGKDKSRKVYGFENYEHAGKKDIMDFSREDDGTMTPQSPNVAAAQLTYDTYSVLGQGMTGNFRPFRTDVGRVHDPVQRNFVLGGSVAFDVGAGHVGWGGTVTSGYSVQKPWDYKKQLASCWWFRIH